MFNTKRKRAVVLALIAFFCGATGYVAVDWKRFGGGFLAFFKSKGDPVVTASGGGSSSGAGGTLNAIETHPNPGPNLQVASTAAHRHTSSVGGGSGGHKGDDDLFKYGDPAAGGIPANSFVVAQNDTPGGTSNNGGAGLPPSLGAPAAPESVVGPTGGGDTGSGGGGGGVTSPAPAPAGGNGGVGDGGGIIGKSPSPAPSTTTPPPPPTTSTPTPPPPATTPVTPPPPPTQSGTSDNNPGDGDGNGDPTGGGTTPVASPPSVSVVPEASDAAMMTLGALFLAAVAMRKRKDEQA